MIDLDSPSDSATETPELAARGVPLRFRERARQRLGGAELLVFAAGAERFGVELRSVEEALESPDVRRVPEAPPGLLGLFTLHDQLLPLFSTAHVLGAAAATAGIALVMRSGARRLGLAVDDVEDIVAVNLKDLQEAPDGVNDDDVVAGLLWSEGQLITVLDARALANVCASAVAPAS